MYTRWVLKKDIEMSNCIKIQSAYSMTIQQLQREKSNEMYKQRVQVNILIMNVYGILIIDRRKLVFDLNLVRGVGSEI